ncbi:MAG TPA: hypothetical protein VG347_03580 [Verrucomicrobiae bacterium]|nr:hypothetical protein [Verrucomicrobiae bacterium]
MKNEEARMNPPSPRLRRTGNEEANKAWASLRVIAAEGRAAERVAGDVLSTVAAKWVTPKYLLSLREELTGLPDGPDRFKLLRQAAGDVVGFQRGDFLAGSLALEARRLKFDEKKHKDRVEGRVTSDEGKKRRDLNEPMTEEELKACVDKVDEIMGLK